MTRPGIGSAEVDVHANTRPFDMEVFAGVKKGADAADAELKVTGEKMGHTLGKGIGDGTAAEAPHIARTVEQALNRQVIKTKTTVQFDSSGNEVKRWVTTIEKEVANAFSDSGGGNKIGKSFGQGILDGIGNAFNISGKSPLVFAFIPVIGAIVELVAGAIQAISALTAVLAALPGILFAIGLQAGVLFLIFKNILPAIQGAFAAKNATELQKALEHLTPSAQTFVKSLLPLRDLVKALSDVATSKFFDALEKAGDIIGKIQLNIGHQLAYAADQLGTALGGAFQGILSVFADPKFAMLITILTNSAATWLTGFGGAIQQLLRGFTDLGIAVQPFMDWFGAGFNSTLADFGKWLSDISATDSFKDWLDRMKDSLNKFGDVLTNATKLLEDFTASVDKAGGNKALDNISGQLKSLDTFFSSDVGVKFLQGLIVAAEGLAWVLIGSVLTLGLVVASLVAFFEWYDRVTTIAGDKVHEFFHKISEGWTDFWAGTSASVGTALDTIGTKFGEAKDKIVAGLRNAGDNVKTFLTVDLPDAAKEAVKGAGTWLWDAGKNVLHGLTNGIRDALPDLHNAMSEAASLARKFWPFSPAKLGPLSGSGDLVYAGQNIIQRISAGIQMETPTLAAASNNAAGSIYFGPGSVRVGFDGVVPTAAQAQATGMAAGGGIANALAVRNTQLQIRTM